ncbi:MAG: hypothetical protein R3231_00425 [bacterium]|nr:hypothetical protein [bacterium]
MERETPATDKIEAAVEQARTSMAGPAEGETPLEEALAAAAAEEKGGVEDSPLQTEEVPAAQGPLEPGEEEPAQKEELAQEEEPASPFARAMSGAGAGAVLQGSPDKGPLEKAEVLPEGAVSETEAPEKAEEPEPVKAEAVKLPDSKEVKKKSSLAMPALAGLGAVLVGVGLIYFLKGRAPESPPPPATTVQPPVAEKSPAEIIRELAEEGGGEELAKVVGVPDRAAAQPGEEDGPAKESAVTIQEEAGPPAENAVPVDLAARDGAQDEKAPGGTDDLPVKVPAPIADVVSPKAGAKAVAEPPEKSLSDGEAKKAVAVTSGAEDAGAAEPQGEAKPTAAPPATEDPAPAKAEVPERPVPSEAPAKTVKQTPTVQGTWEEHYARGLKLFSNGSLEPAFKAWADTVRSAPDQAYAIQIELTSYLSYAARDIKEAAPDEKVFIVKATLNDKEYYKVLCGFYPDKAAAEQAFRVLTPYLKAQKPYLVRAIRLKPDLQD